MGGSTQPVGIPGGQVVDKLTDNNISQLSKEASRKGVVSLSLGDTGDKFTLFRPSKSDGGGGKPRFFSIFWTQSNPETSVVEVVAQTPESPESVKDPVTDFHEQVERHVKNVLYTAFWENEIPCTSLELGSLVDGIYSALENNPQYLSDLWVSPNDWWQIYLNLGDEQQRTVLKLGLETEFDFCAFMGPVEAERKNLNEAQLGQIYNDVKTGDPETQKAFFRDVLPSMDVEAGAEVVLRLVKNKSLIGDGIYNKDVIHILSSSVHFHEIYQLDLLLNGPENFFRHPELSRLYPQGAVENAVRFTAFPNLDFDVALKQYGLSKNKELKQKLIETSYDPQKVVKDVVAQALRFRHKDQQPWEEIWEGFMKDSAFQWVSLIQPQWMDEFFPGPNQTPEESQAVLLVARFLEANQTPVNEQTVKEAYQCILETKELTYNIPLFEGRHVLVMACDQKDERGNNVFGNEKSLSLYKAKGALSQNMVRLSDPQFALMGLQEKLDTIKDMLIHAPSPLTLIFDTHGGTDGSIKLSEDIYLYQSDLAEIFEARAKISKENGLPPPQDIVLFLACFNANIMEKLSDILDQHGVRSPLMAGPSEYGQIDWTNPNLVSNSTFLNLLLNKEKPVFGHTTELDYNTNLHTNPSTFVTTWIKGVLRTIQIAENETKKTSVKPV